MGIPGSENGGTVPFFRPYFGGICPDYSDYGILVGGFNPSKQNVSQLGILLPMYGKNVPNLQPVWINYDS